MHTLTLCATLARVGDAPVVKPSGKVFCPPFTQSHITFLSVAAMCAPGLPCVSGPGSLKARTQRDARSQSCIYPADGSSQASLLAGNLYMDLDNGTYLCRVLVCSLAHLMFCRRLWILGETLPCSPSPYPHDVTYAVVHRFCLSWWRATGPAP